jgi:hypothetical protein
MSGDAEFPQTTAMTPQTLDRVLQDLLRTLSEGAAPWQAQLEDVLSNGETDLSSDADTIIEDMKLPVHAMNADGTSGKRDPMESIFAKRYAPIVDHMAGGMANISKDLHVLSVHCTRVAAQMDPDAPRRLLYRMRNLGDTVLRQIEGRLALTDSRTERKRLQDLRDNMWKWMSDRDERIHDAQLAAEDLAIRADAIRMESLSQTKRLSQVADLANDASGPISADPHEGLGHAKPEAAEFSALLRIFALIARTKIEAPLRDD